MGGEGACGGHPQLGVQGGVLVFPQRDPKFKGKKELAICTCMKWCCGASSCLVNSIRGK